MLPKKRNTLLILLLSLVFIFNCDMPKKADFRMSHKVEAPLLLNKEYRLLGGENALLDTTSADYSSLFEVAGDDHITLSVKDSLDIGDMNDALPELEIDPVSIRNKIGDIELSSFSSGSDNLGSADFQELTGMDPSFIGAGTQIPAGASLSPVNINVGAHTDFFVSATVKNGGIDIHLTNNLGFNLDVINITLNSGFNPVGTTTVNNLINGSNETAAISFAAGTVLENLNVDLTISWSQQNMQSSPGSVVIEEINGNNLVASQIVAAVEPQDFSTAGTTDFSNDDFSFGSDNSYYVDIKSGELQISPIINGLDLTVENLTISFPGIRSYPYNDSDSLVVNYSYNEQIPRFGYSGPKQIDLQDYRIYAPNNEIHYNVLALTENTQAAPAYDRNRNINENQEISTNISLQGLSIKEAYGILAPKKVVLVSDEYGDDQLDLFNDEEAVVTELSDIETFSNQIKGIKFDNPSLTINYTTDIGFNTTFYGVWLGIAGDGTSVYLSGAGKDGTYQVQPGDPVSGLNAYSAQIPDEHIIKFKIDKAPTPALYDGALVFNKNNSNVDEFLNNLPSKIRFIGFAEVNENGEAGRIGESFTFDTEVSYDIPLALTAENATFKDTLDQDLSDLPSPEKGDDSKVIQGTLEVLYSNGIPLGLDVQLRFFDEFDNLVTSVPFPTELPIQLHASDIDPSTNFAATAAQGEMILNLNEEQLEKIYLTRKMELSILMNSTEISGANQKVKLRATDSIKLGVRIKILVETDVK